MPIAEPLPTCNVPPLMTVPAPLVAPKKLLFALMIHKPGPLLTNPLKV